MRLDKLTSRFQEALADAQSLAVTRDNPYIEPAHVLAAMLAQDDGPRALLERAGVHLPALQTALEAAIKRCRRCRAGEQVQAGRDLGALLQAAEKEADQARRPVHRQRDVPARRWPTARPTSAASSREHGLTRKALEAAIDAVRGGQKRRTAPTPKASARR